MSDKEKDLSAFIPEGWEGKLPPCMIQVDREGQLSSNGAPMIHPGILELIYESVYEEDGSYFLKVGEQSCQLEVADTFYVVCRVGINGPDVTLTLNDGSTEKLDPGTIFIGDDDVLYCRVKNSGHRARFLRPAYYQVAEHVVEEGDGFVLVLGDQRYELKPEA